MRFWAVVDSTDPESWKLKRGEARKSAKVVRSLNNLRKQEGVFLIFILSFIYLFILLYIYLLFNYLFHYFFERFSIK